MDPSPEGSEKTLKMEEVHM